MKARWLLPLLPALLSGPACADEPRWALGLGAGLADRPYAGAEARRRLMPLVLHESRWLSLMGPQLDLKLPLGEHSSLRLRARYADEGYEAGDAPRLDGLGERKGGVWLGLALQSRTALGRLSAEWLRDTSGHSRGQRARLGWEAHVHAGSFMLSPRAALLRVDARYADYYFGVPETAQRADRPAFRGRAASGAELGLRLGYALDGERRLLLDLGATRWDGALRASPLHAGGVQRGLHVGFVQRL